MGNKSDELYYALALSLVEGVGAGRFRQLVDTMGSAQAVMSATASVLRQVEGLPKQVAENVRKFDNYKKVDTELLFCEKHSIKVHTIYDDMYPHRLKQCIDAPPITFQKGSANVNAARQISIVGTRNYTDYGKKMCEELVAGLVPYDVNIVSGLAYGIDVISHKACLKHNIATIGVLAHGLSHMHPKEHANVAAAMVEQGALLTEYTHKTKPERGHFPMRNRIVAGLSDATIVVETDTKGGSMITANLAFGYHRDVLCIPGRTTDIKSSGCNWLIQNLKGQLINNADDVAKCLGWKQKSTPKNTQKKLFVELPNDEMKVYTILNEKGKLHIDELSVQSEMPMPKLSGVLLSLEIQNLVAILPGKMIDLL